MKRGFLSKVVFAVIFLMPTTFLFQNSASAENAPKIKARLTETRTVNLTISSSSRKRGKVTVIRAVDGSSSYQEIAQFRVRGSTKVRFADQITDATSLVAYRSRLTGASRSGWSRPVMVDVTPEVKEPRDKDPTAEVPVPTPEPTKDPETSLPPINLPAGYNACPRAEVLKVINRIAFERSLVGLGALAEQANLAYSSQKFSLNMAITGNFAHDGWYDNIVASGFRGTTAGQNIAYSNRLSAEDIMNGLMGSPGHKANILAARYIYVGIGCVQDPRGFTWWTQDFGG